MKDTLFRSGSRPKKFRFDEQVAGVFDDMLSRSVPFYGEVQEMIASLAADHYRPGTIIYDLGCSTGTTMVSLCDRIGAPGLKIVGIDSSMPVISKAEEKLASAGLSQRTKLLCADVMDADLKDAGVVIMNYTLQFIKPALRPVMIGKIYRDLADGGILLLSEKVLENDNETSRIFIEKHHIFKRSMGYSELEISKKREALDDVLIPFTVDEEFKLLSDAGFKKTSLFFKWFNFASFLAIKS